VLTLYLLRHAKSSWDDPGLADHDRPLAPRGLRNAEVLAEQLRAARILPELVLCSTAQRARETLAAVLPAFDGETEILVERALYGSSARELLERLHAVPEAVGSTMVVAHNPGLEELASRLAGDAAPERLPTAALVELSSGATWATLGESPCRVVSSTVPR
jgi:phosphohistidine phosphatase